MSHGWILGATLAVAAVALPVEAQRTRVQSETRMQLGGEMTPPTPRSNDELYPASSLVKLPLHDEAGQPIGRINDAIVDAARGKVAYAVVSFDKGPAAGKLFAVPFGSLRPAPADGHAVLTVPRNRFDPAAAFDATDWPDLADPDRAHRSRDNGEPRRWLNRVSRLHAIDVRNTDRVGVGDVKELMVDPRDGRIVFALMEVKSLPDRIVAVPWSAFDIQGWRAHYLLGADSHTLTDASFSSDRWPDFSDAEWARRVHSLFGEQRSWELYGIPAARTEREAPPEPAREPAPAVVEADPNQMQPVVAAPPEPAPAPVEPVVVEPAPQALEAPAEVATVAMAEPVAVEVVATQPAEFEATAEPEASPAAEPAVVAASETTPPADFIGTLETAPTGTVAGKVLSVERYGEGETEGLRLRILTDAGSECLVDLGPRSRLEASPIGFATGDRVEVTGPRLEVMRAAHVRRGKQELNLESR